MDPTIQSTPQNKGTSAYSEFVTDHCAGSPSNIRRVETDLEKGTQSVHILPFLRALLAEIVLECKGSEAHNDDRDHVFLGEVEKEGEQTFKQMLDDAISFCNDKENDNRNELMEHLEDYTCEPYENDRYLPLSNALNTILLEFSSKSYGSIPRPNLRKDKEDLILMPNDPNVIESIHLRDDCPKARRKPDVVGVFTSYLNKIDHKLEAKSYEEITNLVSEGAVKWDPARPPEWSDIRHTWELKVKDRDMEMPECDNWALEKIMNDLSKKPKNNSRKRARNTNYRARKKKNTKKPSGLLFPSIHTNILPNDPGSSSEDEPSTTVSTVVQCAYYGMEQSSSAWHVTHSIVVLLEDYSLSVLRFDAQGCIQSETFNILEQLPILVVMMIILQRFSLHTWGLTERDSMKVKVENKVFRLSPTRTPFQLIGRRTTGTSAKYEEEIADESSDSSPVRSFDEEVCCGTSTEGGNPDDWDDGMPFFFKSSWTEWVRVLEFLIIREAHKRANTLLPEKYRRMVTEHIPKIIAAQECKTVSTARFRLFLKFAGAFPHLTVDDIKKRARVRVWMVMPRLLSIHNLEPSTFLSVFWDSIRCHYLLWRFGVAHGDISLTNLMCSPHNSELIGILNDFDLAAIMKPGTRSPEKTGWERTGTLAFLALDLLKFHKGETRRWYRHELESFTWCLLWEMLKHPRVEWTTGTLATVLNSKRGFQDEISEKSQRIKHEWALSFDFLENWFAEWTAHKNILANYVTIERRKIGLIPDEKVGMFRDQKDCEVSDASHIRAAVACAREWSAELNVAALLDTTWIDVELESQSPDAT